MTQLQILRHVKLFLVKKAECADTGFNFQALCE